MATLVAAPRAPHNTTTTRPRAVVPIVPVVPRSLQAKRKLQPALMPLKILNSPKHVVSRSPQPIERQGGAPPVPEGRASVAYANGTFEASRDGSVSGTGSNDGNGGMPKPLQTATDTSSPYNPSDQKVPAEILTDCGQPLQQAPYMIPAPFYPANHFPGPSSLVSPTFPHGPPDQAQITPPQSHQSSGNIVFGRFPGSAGPSPILPPSPSAMAFLPRTFANWAPPQPRSRQHCPDTHPQHDQAPGPSWHGHLLHQAAHPQLNVYDSQRHSYAVPPGYHHGMPSFFPPENHYPYTPPPGTPFVNSIQPGPPANGASFSTSSIGSHSIPGSVDLHTSHPGHYTENRPHDGVRPGSEQDASRHHVVATDDGVRHSHSRGGSQRRVDSPAQPNVQASSMELGNVSNYLISQFNRKGLADCCLRLSHSHGKFKATSIYLHGLLITRSPFLAGLLSFTGPDATGCKRLQLELSGDLVRSDAFELALLHLYGEPLLEYESLIRPDFALSGNSTTTLGISHSDNIMVDQFEFAIGYAAAGEIFQLPAVKRRGDELASKLISWETLERGLTFTMNGGRGMEKPAVNPILSSHPSTHAPSRKSSTHSTASLNSNKENSAIRIPCDAHTRDGPRDTCDIHGHLANGLLRDISRYIGSNFPSDFRLQTSAPSLPTVDRLPSTVESRTFSDPRLSSLQFGSHPSEEVERPNLESVTISRIFISVPFPVLALIFGHLTPEIQARHAPSIIEERERRRYRVLQSKSVPWASRLAGGARWNEVGWEESVGASPAEAGRNERLVRRWTGLQRPTRTRAHRV